MHGWFAFLIQSQKPSLELDDCLVFMFVLRKLSPIIRGCCKSGLAIRTDNCCTYSCTHVGAASCCSIL